MPSLFIHYNSCLWEEIKLDENMFVQMVELLHHLGLACRLPSEDPDDLNLLVPWFLSEYPGAVEGLSENLSTDQVCILFNIFFQLTHYQYAMMLKLNYFTNRRRLTYSS